MEGFARRSHLALDPSSNRHSTTSMAREAALLFTDIVDSTSTTQRLGDDRAAALWAEHDRRARDLLRKYNGREIGRSDGLLTLFEAPADAARYALDYRAEAAELGLAARAGMHVGPIVLREASAADVALGAQRIEADGLALPLASRLMAMARGGQTLLTQAARTALDPAALHGAVEIRSHGHYRLKGIDEPVAIFEIGNAGLCSFVPPPDSDKSYRVVRRGELWQPVRDIPHELPAEPDSFFGRASDLAAIAHHFNEGSRLLTLLGPGGTGKTRLAIRYGRGALGEWPGGIWFCDLSDASTLDAIHYATASALNIRLGSGDPEAELTEAIAGRGRCLIVLDNFEQVAEHAAATVGRWLDAHDATFMVTSRERLHLPGEVVQVVEPLPVDGPAIDLFVARARAVRRELLLDEAQRSVVAEIVKLLDGLPLAIELAAARIVALSPSQLLERLRDRFKLLAGRRGASRQSTLRATIDWSWQLLAAWEQSALEQCSVFEGGFTLAAAERIVELPHWTDAPSILDVMQALVDKSLLRRWMPSDAPSRHDIDELYFGMYINIHEYAAEKCRAHGSERLRCVQERHGRYFATFGTDEALEALFTHGGPKRMRALRHELDNLVSACRSAIARVDAATAVACYRAAWEVLALQGPFRIAVALGDEILAMPALDGHLAEQARLSLAEALARVGATEGLEGRLTEALERVRAIADRKLEVRILGRLGNLCLWSGRVEEAGSRYEEALQRARAIEHRLLEARMHGNVAIAHHERGRHDEAATHYEAALAIEREIGSLRDEAITLCNFADLLGARGQSDDARQTFATALALLRELGDRDTEAITLQQLGELELGQGLIDEALPTLRTAVDLSRAIGNRRVYGQALRGLGAALLERGKVDEARSAFEQALAIARSTTNRRIETTCLSAMGELALREGRLADAATLLADAETILRELGDQPLLAKLLCARGELDLRRGDRSAAEGALSEAKRLAVGMHSGEASTLSRAMERLQGALQSKTVRFS